MTVVDVGTGSGILAEAAVKLGAGEVHATDNDPEAVAVARENFARAESRFPCRWGRRMFCRKTSPTLSSPISARMDRGSRAGVGAGLKPGGVAILSGFEANDIARVSAALETAERAFRLNSASTNGECSSVRPASYNDI